MKISFSTLACPDWSLERVLDLAGGCGYDGVELRFLDGEDALWKLPIFQGSELATAVRRIQDKQLEISCLDTSCRFDSPEKSERDRWIIEGERMAELAARLEAPGIRVFGDRIHPGANRGATRNWIVDCLEQLTGKIVNSGVQIWLETHGDFAGAAQVSEILSLCPRLGIVWDPANAFMQSGESPLASGAALKSAIRHVHIKDVRQTKDGWIPVLNGVGNFPWQEMRTTLEDIGYSDFLSFEWEKKWHPKIEEPGLAVPHFAAWFHREWAAEGGKAPTRRRGGSE